MLLGGAGAGRARELGRIRANASCEVVDEALTGGKPRRIPGVDDDAEVLEPGHARAELVERLNARCIPREQLREIALRERLLECAHARVHAVGVRVDLGGTAPHRDGAIAAALPNEGADVVAELRDHVRLRRAAFHVRAVQPLHVLGVADAAHRLDGAQLVLHEIDVLRAQHMGMLGRSERIVFEDVPRAELELVEVSEGREVGDLRRASLGALSEADGPELRERPHACSEATPSQGDACDERRRYGAEPGQ